MSKFDSNIVTSYFYSVTEQVWLLVALMDPMARTSFLSKDTIRFLRIPTQAPRIGHSEPEPGKPSSRNRSQHLSQAYQSRPHRLSNHSGLPTSVQPDLHNVPNCTMSSSILSEALPRRHSSATILSATNGNSLHSTPPNSVASVRN